MYRRNLAFVLVAGLIVSAEKLPSGRIIGGEVAKRGAWPWMVNVWTPDPDGGFSHVCGGVLLDKRWVLSAAHCLFGNPSVEVLLGGIFNNGTDAVQRLQVQHYIRHPRYDPQGASVPNDISLLHLAADANISHPYISTISLPQNGQDFVNNSQCWINGWGTYSNNGTESSPIMKQANISVITNQACQSKYHDMTILDTQICSGTNSAGTVGPCDGDSGGPIQCRKSGDRTDWVVAGVLSLGDTPCSHYPGVYTRVTQYLDWITQHVPNV